MKIQKVTIKNFKILKDLEKEINGSNIIVFGDNDVGKSTFIQAIEIGLGLSKEIPPNSNGEINIITNDKGEEYQFKTILREGKQIIEVIAPNGLRDNRKSTIGSLVGAIDFDIDEFVELSNSKAGKKKQIEIVKTFLDHETQIELGKIEREIEAAYSDRTEINRNIKSWEGFIKELNLSKDDLSNYSTKIEISLINEKLQKSIELNSKIDSVIQRNESRNEQIERNTERIHDLEKEISLLKSKSKELIDLNTSAEKWLKENKRIDTSEFERQINDSNYHNEMYNKVQDYYSKEKKLNEFRKEEKELTRSIETNRQLLTDAVRDSELPVKELTFNEDTLLYKGFEVDEKCLSTSEIIHLGIQLKMAKNPNVNAIFLQRGESLGIKKLKLIQELCKEKGYQIIMEKVEPGTEELKIEIMPELK